MSVELNPGKAEFELTNRLLGRTVVGIALEVPQFTPNQPPIDFYPANTWMWLARRNAQNSNGGLLTTELCPEH